MYSHLQLFGTVLDWNATQAPHVDSIPSLPTHSPILLRPCSGKRPQKPSKASFHHLVTRLRLSKFKLNSVVRSHVLLVLNFPLVAGMPSPEHIYTYPSFPQDARMPRGKGVLPITACKNAPRCPLCIQFCIISGVGASVPYFLFVLIRYIAH